MCLVLEVPEPTRGSDIAFFVDWFHAQVWRDKL